MIPFNEMTNGVQTLRQNLGPVTVNGFIRMRLFTFCQYRFVSVERLSSISWTTVYDLNGYNQFKASWIENQLQL